MINTVLALTIVCGSMFLTIKVVDLVLSWLNIAPKREGIQSSKPAQITERVIDSFQLYEYSPHCTSAISACENEAGTVCIEIINNSEDLAGGIEAVVESAGESISVLVESLSN